MKAKYGIASVACWLISVAVFAAIFIGPNWDHGTDRYLFVHVILVALGLLLAFLGATKKETPKGYYFAGFFLNFAWFCFPLVNFYNEFV